MKMDRIYRLLYCLIWPFFNLFHPVKVIGRENIPQGAALVCPNHIGAGDPLYVVFAFGRKEPLRIMAKQEILNWPVIGPLLGLAGVFGVERGKADVKAAKAALKCLSEGRRLLIFPEGTRVRKGEESQAKGGAALFATRAGVPLLPVFIEKKRRVFRPTHVVIGKPYQPQLAGRKATPAELQAIADGLMDNIRALEAQVA